VKYSGNYAYPIFSPGDAIGWLTFEQVGPPQNPLCSDDEDEHEDEDGLLPAAPVSSRVEEDVAVNVEVAQNS
jgi:hypothetical protein